MVDTITTTSVITWQDVLEREARDGTAPEIVNGQWLEQTEMAGQLHGLISGRIFALLYAFVKSNQLGEVYPDNTTYILEGTPDQIITRRIPDISFLREEKVDRTLQTALLGAPDLAVEVLSPSERPGQTAAKIADYLHYGSAQVWVVFPEEQEIAVHTPDGKVKVYGEAVAGGNLLPGLSLNLAEVF